MAKSVLNSNRAFGAELIDCFAEDMESFSSRSEVGVCACPCLCLSLSYL